MDRIFDKPTMSDSQKSIAATEPFVRGFAGSRLSVFERNTSKASGDQFEIVKHVVNFSVSKSGKALDRQCIHGLTGRLLRREFWLDLQFLRQLTTAASLTFLPIPDRARHAFYVRHCCGRPQNSISEAFNAFEPGLHLLLC